MPEEVKEAEMDEIFTFIGDKKQNLHLTVVDRKHVAFRLGSGVDTHPDSYSANDR